MGTSHSRGQWLAALLLAGTAFSLTACGNSDTLSRTFGLLNGFGTWSYLVLAAVALAVVAALGVWLRRAESPLVAVSLGAIAGGAIGNVIDRLRFGSVVDFIDVHLGDWHWYVFNVADAAIVCGVAALVLENLLPVPHKREKTG